MWYYTTALCTQRAALPTFCNRCFQFQHGSHHPALAGIPLSAVLQQLGVKSVAQGARWVHFADPDDELRGVSSYATCLDLEHCLNPANDVLLAYKQNGRWGLLWHIRQADWLLLVEALLHQLIESSNLQVAVGGTLARRCLLLVLWQGRLNDNALYVCCLTGC
jgi:hypothetical protein